MNPFLPTIDCDINYRRQKIEKRFLPLQYINYVIIRVKKQTTVRIVRNIRRKIERQNDKEEKEG